MEITHTIYLSLNSKTTAKRKALHLHLKKTQKLIY